MATKQKGKALDIYLIKRVISYAMKYKGRFYLTLSLTLLLALISPLRPYMIQWTVDHYVLTGDIDGMTLMTLAMVAVLLIETGFQYLQTYFSGWIGQQVIRDLRVKLFGHLTRFKLGHFDKTPIGTSVTRVVNDIETIADMFGEGMLSIVGDLLKLLLVLVAMWLISPGMTLVSLIPVPLLVLTTWIFKNGVRKSFTEVRNEVANLNAFTQEHITGMTMVQAFNREEEELRRFKAINKRHRKAHIRSVWYYSVFFPAVELLQAISIALVVWYGTYFIMTHPEGPLQPGVIISFILYTYMLYRPMRQLADRFNTLQMGVVSADRIFKLLDEQDQIEPTGATRLSQVKGEVIFKDVSFGYQQEHPVLHNIDIHLKPGEKLAVVGSTGSGKSTLISLLCRLYEPQHGEITIDGIPLHTLERESIHRHIGVVTQDVFLFSDTIAKNISLNDPKITEAQLREAAKAVGALPFIEKLPGGFQFNVRERGAMLSAGQRQLLAFIRAYVYNPAILILDEATSAIDSESEQLIKEATETMTKGRTSILIAHRMSTVQHVDTIIVMDKGHIVEQGSHEALLSKNGMYRRLFDLQFSEV